jgi:hypothetical protein
MLVLMFLARSGESQEKPNLPPLQGPVVASITSTKSLWGANPSYYSISVSSMGTTSYWAVPNSDQRTGEPEMDDFTATNRTRNEIFKLTQKLDFFKGEFTNRDVNGRTGWKSPTFAEGPIRNEIDYTSSKNRSIKRFTRLFESIANTMEYGWKLSRLRADDPTALAAQLKQMQSQVTHRQLAEFGAIAPIVRDIAFDPRIPEASRRYALNLLKETRSLGKDGARAALDFEGPRVSAIWGRGQE